MSGSSGLKRHYMMFDFADECWEEQTARSKEVSRFVNESEKPPGHKAVGSWEFKPANGMDAGGCCGKELHSLLLAQHTLPTLRAACDDRAQALTHVGIDLRLRSADYWNPATATQRLFGNRSAAHQLMQLPPPHAANETFPDVNVVIVDKGIDSDLVRACRGRFAGGWQSPSSPVPGETKGGHGSMLARNVLSVAPGANIFDFPLIPPTFSNIPAFLCDAHAAFEELFATISHYQHKQDHPWKRPWVILNAWAVFNNGNEHDDPSLGHAYNYAYNSEHPLAQIVGRVAERNDVVFAAGNCGQFCPSGHCGARNVGPGRSILGVNSHPKVLTVGAVRTDGLWLGYSSQGPGALANAKPDVCAPSQFGEDADYSTDNTGTSAASALAAGLVARHRAENSEISPQDLKDRVIRNASRLTGADPYRLGSGIIRSC